MIETSEPADADGPVIEPVLVRCQDATRVYGRGPGAVPAVRAASCEVSAGDQIAVTGSSGSGKSTLLHLMGGLDAPTAGTVVWPGLPGYPGRAAVVGFVFQAPSLLPQLDVAENVALPLLIAGLGETEARRRALDALATLAIAELAGRLPGELSGGQAQRVAVARVLAIRPALILADEPTARLDPAHRDQVIDALLALSGRLGAALVVSTHDTAVATRFTRCWQMRDGRLLSDAESTTFPAGEHTW